ncbi:GFA family protein [Parvibaculum sp.]|uniref:GFA family protein n=1 Tax=Parvibaculum sp. TaxID=2024848 RepID=UPI000C45A6A3|nr:GFA family protein [Parvibaculum sp.]MAU61884.1 aldehyde-activating protein [Parvibaculum sp.]MBO6666774.1 GFA family protein [Parvibaculum sp.]MBO6693615.1 GFA family protein [Parvibaculum sp.]MBO6713395.1 GFA family protein [Parvibaculum sp.]
MSDWKLPREGGCLCGKVRFRITAPPLLTMACHCKGCQRLTASAFSLSAAVPSGGFELVQGEPVIGALHGPHKHYFCDYCMSWLFTRPDGMDWFVNVRAPMLDDPAGFSTPYVETAAAEKLPWVKTPAARSFDGFPDLEAMTSAVEEFATLGGPAS